MGPLCGPGPGGSMGVMAKNKEDYISFSVDVAVDTYVDKLENEKEKLINLLIVFNLCPPVWIL